MICKKQFTTNNVPSNWFIWMSFSLLDERRRYIYMMERLEHKVHKWKNDCWIGWCTLVIIRWFLKAHVSCIHFFFLAKENFSSKDCYLFPPTSMNMNHILTSSNSKANTEKMDNPKINKDQVILLYAVEVSRLFRPKVYFYLNSNAKWCRKLDAQTLANAK